MTSSNIILVLSILGFCCFCNCLGQTVGVGNSLSSLPFDYGLNLIYLIQNSTIKRQIQKAVSETCSLQIDWFFENLNNVTDDGMWAFKMLDSSAKVPAGLLKLNLGGWMGDFDQCLEISSERRQIKGKYCLGTLYINIDEASGAVSEILLRKVNLFAQKKYSFQDQYPVASYPSFGICVPNGCNEQDLQHIVASFNLTFPLPFECQTFDDANPPLTTKAWCVIGFFVVIIGLMVGSTAYDLHCRKSYKVKQLSGQLDDKIMRVASEPQHTILVAFSVYSNGKKLFKTQQNASELACLNGIRVLSMVWVLAGHSVSVTVSGPVSNALDVLEYLDSTKSMIFVSAVHSVDTFLMVTGLLVVYSHMKAQENGTKFKLLVFYFHRYLRLTPPFLAAILVSMALLQYMGSGPHWSFIVNYFQVFCEKSWWSALLYFQNYINVNQWCIGQTWYLNIDWQLYLCAPIFLLTLSKNARLGLILLSTALLIFTIIPFWITWTNELPAIITNLHGDITGYQQLYYLRTHTRASPWFVGAIIGYLIARLKFDKLQNQLKMNKALLWGIWLVVLTLIPVCIFVGHDSLRSEYYNKYGNAFYNSLLRPTWAVCIGWIAFACSNGYGGIINTLLSLPIFQILSRFTYSVYLLHVTMLYMIIYASKTPAYFSFFHVAYSFWGITMMALAVSMFWVLAFESPVIIIEKRLLSKSQSRKLDLGQVNLPRENTPLLFHKTV
uniref:Nose resistant-to-fluoxetine protein N-terminal domain-containing protein n=2 Tax=Dendroctonus ponderosae TaxID=77166 RepID=A0AAR5PLN8_DENPD